MEKYYEIYTKNGTIRGIIHIPSKVVWKYPIVMFHGYFSANRIGPARLYLLIARKLVTMGFCIARFDCLGVGESDGDFSKVTFYSELRDYITILNYVTKLLKTQKTIIIAHSMGANLAIYVSKKLQQKVQGLILISPDIEKRGGINHLFTKKQLNEIRTKGITVRKGLYISASFINRIRNKSDLFDVASGLKCPVFIIQGKRDELYSSSGAKQLAKIIRARLIWIKSGDHNFLNEISRNELISKIKKIIKKLNVKL
ncbi:MAG: alpha/beta fold hydrolase [candidate division WOR-3 bacterium]